MGQMKQLVTEMKEAPEEGIKAFTTQAVLLRLPLPLKEAERRVIMASLEANGGSRVKTARSLGISLRTLQRRLKEYSKEAL